MRPGPVLALAALAAVAAAVVDAQATPAPAPARNALLVIAGVLLALVALPALARRWPGEPAPARRPHDTQLDDLAAVTGRPAPR